MNSYSDIKSDTLFIFHVETNISKTIENKDMKCLVCYIENAIKDNVSDIENHVLKIIKDKNIENLFDYI